ncbi:MAG: hypothetical protein GX238_02865 [Epulopiscium sp.]|nr:hypothetical protein [Candidatus Epulonipiscium sp.]
MDLTNEIKEINYEEAMPILQVSIQELHLSLAPSSVYTGAFTIENKGGGQLRGKVFCSHPYLQCTPNQWENNKQVCMYRIDTKGMSLSQTYESSFTILSNGGEDNIFIFITIEDSVLSTHKWDTMKGFLEYAKNHWEEAVEQFYTQDFYYWLHQDTFLPFLPLYQYVKNQLPSQGLESFLVGGGFKMPARWNLINKSTYIRIATGQSTDLEYVIEIQKEQWGYIEGTITTNVEWIQLWKEKISSNDFDQQGRGYIPYRIIPEAINKSYQRGKIIIETSYQRFDYEVQVVKNPSVQIHLSKKSFTKEDKGEVIITNNTGEDLVIHIRSSAAWVQFKAQKYLIANKASIPFFIHFTKWDQWKYQIFSSNRLFYETKVMVQTQVNKKWIQKEFKIVVGPEIEQPKKLESKRKTREKELDEERD